MISICQCTRNVIWATLFETCRCFCFSVPAVFEELEVEEVVIAAGDLDQAPGSPGIDDLMDGIALL